jgi:hypothetical protein
MALFTKGELAKKEIVELKKLAKANAIDPAGLSKAELIELLLEIEDEPELEEDIEEELDDEDVELEDEELDEEEDEVAPPKKGAKKSSTPATAAKSKKDASAGDTLAAKQVATLLGTEAKTLRQFLRSDASTFEAVGSGGRYEFTEGDVAKIQKEFEAWRSAHAARGSKRGPNGKKAAVEAEELEEVEEIEELEELDDEIDEEELELEDEDEEEE